MTSHDPTTLNRQGADRGTQYRSVIYYHDDEQRIVAEIVLGQLKTVYSSPIVTELSEAVRFYPAEGYHQDYYNKNQPADFCRMVIEPKVVELKKMYADRLKKVEA